MIGVIFDFGGEGVEVRVRGTQVTFRTNQYGGQFAPIEGLRLDKTGVLREFRDLEGRDDWREEAIKRFKEKIKNMQTEDERIDYIMQDLKKFGYIPLYYQKEGFRVRKLQ